METQWVQCTTVSNECLGGCRSMREHDDYRHRQLIAERDEARAQAVWLTKQRDELQKQRDETFSMLQTALDNGERLLAYVEGEQNWRRMWNK